VHHHEPVGMGSAERRHVLGAEPLVDRAVPLPQQQRGLLHLPVVEAAARAPWVPHSHVLLAPAELEAGVAAQVLVGEEQDLVGASLAAVGEQGPGEDGAGVGGGAHRTAVAPDERLERRRGVHVGDGHHPLDVGHLGEGCPRLLHLVEVGHVRHGAPGVQVGEDHLAGGDR